MKQDGKILTLGGWVSGWVGGGVVLLGIHGRGLPSGSPNSDSISGPKMSYFSTPIFRPDL